MKYLDDFFKLKSAPLLVGMFPNSKEVTESSACYWQARKYVQYLGMKLEDFKIVVVGDGVHPRTGAMFAVRTGADVWSVDPLLRIKDYKISRLNLVPYKIEDWKISAERVLLVGPHSHAKWSDVLKVVDAKEIIIISLPCCYQDDVPYGYDYSFVDTGITSDKRLFHFYRLKR